MAKRFEIKRSKTGKIALWSVICILLSVIIFYGYRIFFLKNFATQSQEQIKSQLEEARQALTNFDPNSAGESFAQIDTELNQVSTEANKFGVLSIASWFDKFKNVPDMLRSLTGVSGTAVHIAEDVSYLKENAMQLMLAGRGDELIGRLGLFQQKLNTLRTYLESLDASSSGFDSATVQKLVQLRAEIDNTDQALSALISFLNADTPRHLLVLFQNPTEMRPAGGFIGSYGIITLDKANIQNIEVRDIYDPDGQLDLKVIPPQTLQLITTKWGARDANWFFDFPTSAKKVIYFLDNSKIYSEKQITFDGAIAINTTVLTDILGVLGPIDLPEYGTTITPDNFLSFVQKEVESGPEKKINQPKHILQVLTPKLMEKLSGLGADGKQALVKRLSYHLEHKNILAYFNDRELELYAKSFNLAGEVYNASTRVVPEYLAVVNTNIAGGKSDAFISQSIDFKSTISETGDITNNLTVTREHTGQHQTEWWYKATNKDYMQIYTSVGSQALATTGRDKWPPQPKITYKTYASDTDVTAIEDTDYYLSDLGLDRFIAFDKTVFAAWLNTPAGKTKKFTLTYKNSHVLNPSSKTPYEFTFEKQSGASTTLSVTIDAPPKYKWKESNSPTLTYESDDPPSRVIIRQTLVPIDQQAEAGAAQ